MTKKLLLQLWFDKYFWFALAAAILYWGVLLSLNVRFGSIGNLQLNWFFYQPLLFLLVGFIYPILEELVFRGLIQGMIARYLINNYPTGNRRFGIISVANIVTSILFVFFHLISHSYLWAISVFIPSIIFGFFREKYDSVAPAILLHVYYNLGYFLLFPP